MWWRVVKVYGWVVSGVGRKQFRQEGDDEKVDGEGGRERGTSTDRQVTGG